MGVAARGADRRVWVCGQALLWVSGGGAGAEVQRQVQRLAARGSGWRIACVPFVSATAAAEKEKLGQKAADQIAGVLRQKGLRVVGPGESAELLIEGSVSRIGPAIGVTVSVRRGQGGEVLFKVSRTISKRDFSALAEEVGGKVLELP